MSESILRLKLESGSFDSKLKRAVGGLQQMESECRKVGGTLSVLEKDQLEYVKALGRMETVSRSARGKLSELKEAFTELSVQYNRLTDEEKKGDFGKALSASLEQLKTRIGESKNELDSIGKSLGDAGKQSQQTGGFMDELAKRFTLNIDVMKLFNVGLQAAETALNVAKDAFFANEQQLDEWGALVESSESIYKGFLNAINTGDINGYLNNINQIVRAANSAYNALDALGTFNAFNQVNVERTRTGMTESIVDYREGKGDKKAVRAAGDAYKKELEERRRLEQQAYIEAVGKVAAERGVSKQDLIDALSGSYGHYQDLKNIKPTGTVTKYSPGIMPGSQGSYTTYTVAQGKQEKLGEALRQLNDTELQSLQALGAQAQRTANEIAQVDRQLVRVLNGRQGGTGGSGGNGSGRPAGGKPEVWAPIAMQETTLAGIGLHSIADVDKAIKRQRGNLANAGSYYERMDAQSAINDLEREKAFMLPNMNPFQEAFKHNFTKDLKSRDKDEKQEEDKSEKTDAKVLEEAGKMVQGMQAITSGVEQLGIDLPQSIQNVTNGITSIISIISGIATILTAIQTLQTAQTVKFWSRGGVVHAAGGMVVPGNHFSGDLIPSMIQSGEVVLNKAQAGVLAHELEGPKNNAMRLETYVSGRDLKIVLNNDSEARGQGRFVTKVGG